MPARVPRLPGAKRSEVLIMGAAGACVLAPLYMIMPGADASSAAVRANELREFVQG